MGPEPFMGWLSIAGVAILGGVVVLALKKTLWVYALVVATPGAGLALVSLQGQVGVSRMLGLSFMFFAIGALLVGIPMSALLWFWRRYRMPRKGTLQ